MFNRDLRGSDTWCGLHNVVVFVMAGVMLMTAEVSAARVSNSFVTIEGDGVYVCDDGRIGFSAGPERSVTATARSGWRVNGRDSVSFKTSPGVFMTLKMTSAFGEDGETVDCEEDEDSEDECEWEEYYETTHVEGTRCAVKVTVDPERQAVMYALPAKGTNVSVSADYEVVARAKHEVYRRWRCAKHQNCDKTHDPEEEFVESFDVEPDTFAWTATGTNGTVGSSAWSGFLSKGLDQKVAFELKASKSGCGDPGCRCEASEKAYVDVYELSIDLPDEYLGLDLTDAMKGRDVTRTATAKIDPAPASATYKWTSCGRCKFIGGKDAASVTYGGNDKTGGSESYLAEPLTVTATAKNAAGQSASASCTTNFTVVAVNVSVGGAGEEGEENSAKEVCYCKDNDDGSLKEFAKANLVPVKITCQPEDLPGIVELAPKSEYAQLFERGKGGSVTLAQTSYPCSEIGKEDFVLHGHSLPDGWMDKVFDAVKSFFVKDSLTVTHSDSGAIDKGVFKVVPPPELQVTVNFNSPGKGGIWPYDPVWDNPAYSNTVDGSLAEWCAGHPGEAKVAYMLSRDAEKVDIEFTDGEWVWSHNVGFIKNAPFTEGFHEKLWAMPKDLDVGKYYAKILAIEAETKAERTAMSNGGQIVRDDYYTSTANEKEFAKSTNTVSLLQEKYDAVTRKLSFEFIAAGSAFVAASLAAEISGSLVVAGFTGVSVETIVQKGSDWVVSITTDWLEVPAWLRQGISTYKYEWRASHLEWNADRYVPVARKANLIPGSVLPSFENGCFSMGYLLYAKPVNVVCDGEIKPMLGVIREGFYSWEEERDSGFVNEGYHLQHWDWVRKPYGLNPPKIGLPSGIKAE